MSTVLDKAIKALEKLIAKRKWLLKRIKENEQKYGMSTEEFLERWKTGILPEPEDPDILADFLGWEVDAEELKRVENELKKLWKVSSRVIHIAELLRKIPVVEAIFLQRIDVEPLNPFSGHFKLRASIKSEK
nr:hypothetical protein [Candidatus Baldrarchaeota archaeon]